MMHAFIELPSAYHSESKTCTYMHTFLMRDERKKQVRLNKQTRQSNTAHPKAVPFPRKNELPRVGLEPTTCTCPCKQSVIHQLLDLELG